MDKTVAIIKANQADSNGEILPLDVLEKAVKEWNDNNPQKLEIYHGKN